MRTQLTAEQAFVVDELWILAWGASVQRAHLYADRNSSNNNRFNALIKNYVFDELLKYYVAGCTEEQHYACISQLVSYGTQLGSTFLLKGYKYGVAQKLLNLALKYYWCSGHIPEPPHCPVDRTIIDKTHLKGKVKWTEITEARQYRDVINVLKHIAGEQTLAQWELSNFRRRQ